MNGYVLDVMNALEDTEGRTAALIVSEKKTFYGGRVDYDIIQEPLKIEYSCWVCVYLGLGEAFCDVECLIGNSERESSPKKAVIAAFEHLISMTHNKDEKLKWQRFYDEHVL